MIGVGDWVRTDKITEEFFEGDKQKFIWFWRMNKTRLKEKGAVSKIGHCIYVHRDKFIEDRIALIESHV